MSDFNIKVKDVKEFVRSKEIIYAAGKGKRFYIALHAGPNVNRYIVEYDGNRTGFTVAGDAVRFFNNIDSIK